MSRISRQLITVAAVIGAAVGAFALVSATGPSVSDDDAAPVVTTYEVQPLVPSVVGTPDKVFSSAVSAAIAEGTGNIALQDDRLTATLTGLGEQVCFEFGLPDETHNGCVAADELRTGLVFVASQSHDGPVDVIGLVPDDVAKVSIGGTTIVVQNNVWHYVGTAGDDLSFEVSSASGVSARRGANG